MKIGRSFFVIKKNCEWIKLEEKENSGELIWRNYMCKFLEFNPLYYSFKSST